MTERVHHLDVLRMTSIATHLTEALYPFIEEVPECGQDIRKVISTLFGIKTCLDNFNNQCRDYSLDSVRGQVLQDILSGVGSCSRSLKDLDSIVLERLNARTSSSSRSAKKCWNEITSSFRNQEGVSLLTSLDEHRTFLLNTVDLLETKFSSQVSRSKRDDKPDLPRLRSNLQQLASQQEQTARRLKDLGKSHRRYREVEENGDTSSRYAHAYQSGYPTPPSSQDSPPQRSYSVPNRTPYHPPPPIYAQPTSPYDRHSMTPGPNMLHTPPISPVSPTANHVGSGPPPPIPRRYSNTPGPGRDKRISTPPSTPPMMPRSALKKPGGMARTTSAVKDSSHWWAHLFSVNPGNTRLSDPPYHGSTCFGKHTETLNLTPRDENVFLVSFDSDLTLRMHRNIDTGAAKVVCTVGPNGGSWDNGRQNGYRKQVCTDANGLTIHRVGSGIHLMRSNLMWAVLYFGDYETLTLFYNAFLALRYYGPDPPPTLESDMWLDGEDLLFSGRINDHGFEHKLRVLKDQESGSIRLAAARAEDRGGSEPIREVTVWTAFITSQILEDGFIFYNTNDTITICDIRQFSFSSSFNTKLRKRFDLKFKNAKDAPIFYQTIDTLKREIQQARPRRSPTSPPLQRNSFF